MTTQHAAIPTTYAGVRFRSRLEARWACIFDRLGWTWEYEPVDFNGWFPDFLITNAARPLYVEVKPAREFPDDVARKIERALNIERELTNPDYEIFITANGCLDHLDDPNYCIGWLFDGWRDNWCGAVLRERCERSGHYGLTATGTGGYFDRMKGCGGPCCTKEGDSNWMPANRREFEAIWKEAGNRVQWRAPR